VASANARSGLGPLLQAPALPLLSLYSPSFPEEVFSEVHLMREGCSAAVPLADMSACPNSEPSNPIRYGLIIWELLSVMSAC
jgi:hypothetical protein